MIRTSFVISCIYLLYLYQIRAEVTRNSALDALDKCAGNITKFIECKNGLKDTLKASGLNMSGHLNLKYHSGALITWSPLNRTEFEAYCEFAPKTDECLSIPRVREACPDELIIKLSDMFSYFCNPDRRGRT